MNSAHGKNGSKQRELAVVLRIGKNSLFPQRFHCGPGEPGAAGQGLGAVLPRAARAGNGGDFPFAERCQRAQRQQQPVLLLQEQNGVRSEQIDRPYGKPLPVQVERNAVGFVGGGQGAVVRCGAAS